MLLPKHNPDSPKLVVARSFYFQKDVIVGIVFKKLSIVIGPYIFRAGKARYGEYIARTDINNVSAIDCEEYIVSCQCVFHVRSFSVIATENFVPVSQELPEL